MKKISAILLTTTALISANSAMADGPGMNDPFFWVGQDAGEPEQTQIEETPSGDIEREGFPTVGSEETTGAKAPENPLLEDYPVEEGPDEHSPVLGESFLPDDGCTYSEQTPATMDFAKADRGPGEFGVSPEKQRRGEQAGDDGVLSAIQETPCVDIMRRGGETANSAKGHLREGDIRRANTLEERNIPTHSVGRYSPEGSTLWHRDPTDPFIDASAEWRVRSGETLSQLLHRWSEDSGFTVVYQANTDYVLQADVVINSTFTEAAGQVIESFANANPPITADFYLANKVIVVRSASEFDGR